MEFMVSQQSKRLIVLEGFKYRIQRVLKDGSLACPCATKTCRAYLRVSSSNAIVDSHTVHTHAKPDRRVLNRQMLSNKLKQKAMEYVSVAPSRLMQSEMHHSVDVSTLSTYDKSLIRYNIHHARRSAQQELPQGAQETHLDINSQRYSTKRNHLRLSAQKRSKKTYNIIPAQAARRIIPKKYRKSDASATVQNAPTDLDVNLVSSPSEGAYNRAIRLSLLEAEERNNMARDAASETQSVTATPNVSNEREHLSSERREESGSGPKRAKMTSDDGETTTFIKLESFSFEADETDEQSYTSNGFDPLVEPTETAQKFDEAQAAHQDIFPASIVKTEPELCQTSGEKPNNGFKKELLTTSKIPAILSDPDAMFFLAQLPFVKSLSSSDRLDFRVKFMQLLQSYLSNPAFPGTSHQAMPSESSP